MLGSHLLALRRFDTYTLLYHVYGVRSSFFMAFVCFLGICRFFYICEILELLEGYRETPGNTGSIRGCYRLLEVNRR
jgi:hypothetical protein